MTHWGLWLISGIICLLGGAFALANPLAATLTAELLTGWTFLLAGIVALISVFIDKNRKSHGISILLGSIMLLLGIGLIAHPLSGIISLTILVGILLLVTGVFQFAAGFQAKRSPLRWSMIISALLSTALGIMIFSDFPQSATLVLGLFLSIQLIANGTSLVFLALALRPGTTD